MQMFRTTGAVSRGFSTWLSAARKSVCTATVAKAKRRVLDLTYIRVLPMARSSALVGVFMRRVALISSSSVQKAMPVE